MNVPLPRLLLLIASLAGLQLRLSAQSGVQFDLSPLTAAEANAAIIAYLGEPVPTPSPLDPRYSAARLAGAFKEMCDRLGGTIESLKVDTSEYPYLLSGVVTGPRFHDEMKNALNAMPGYSYSGSTTGRNGDRTFFALNMIPRNTHSREEATAINRRLMIRLQMLLAKTMPLPPH